ncbi:MAG: hypothetical protein ACYC9O_18390 [Candidatus Latescibacterota bacterium]
MPEKETFETAFREGMAISERLRKMADRERESALQGVSVPEDAGDTLLSLGNKLDATARKLSRLVEGRGAAANHRVEELSRHIGDTLAMLDSSIRVIREVRNSVLADISSLDRRQDAIRAYTAADKTMR